MKKIIIVFYIFMSTCLAQTSSNTSKGIDLLGVQKITVTIGGNFIVTGSFAALEIERVDEFLTRIFIEAQQTALSTARDEYSLIKIKEELSKFALRNIKLKRMDGTEQTLDLMKFRITGNFTENPYLKNGDVLVIPPLDLKRNFVEISGAVNKQGKFQFVEGDKLPDIIQLAMGINLAYENVDSAEISRLSNSGFSEEQIVVGINNEFELKRGDRINILAFESNKFAYKVLVMGEVRRPGFIYVSKNNTKLSEVIEKAGGITENAWLKKANIIRGKGADIFTREDFFLEPKLKELEQLLTWDNMIMSRMSNLTIEDTLYFKMENELRFLNSMGAVDLSELSDQNSEISNFIVNDGDVIIIPEFENTVGVFGQVPNTGKYPFVKDRSYMYYINKAGGFGENSEKEVMLIKANSKNWVELNENVIIEPGDYIWVPKQPIRNFEYYLKLVGNVTSVIAPLVTILILIIQNNNN